MERQGYNNVSYTVWLYAGFGGTVDLKIVFNESLFSYSVVKKVRYYADKIIIYAVAP